MARTSEPVQPELKDLNGRIIEAGYEYEFSRLQLKRPRGINTTE
jgi:hypothetical protein